MVFTLHTTHRGQTDCVDLDPGIPGIEPATSWLLLDLWAILNRSAAMGPDTDLVDYMMSLYLMEVSCCTVWIRTPYIVTRSRERRPLSCFGHCQCSQECGGGQRQRKVLCISTRTLRQVDDSYCNISARPFEIDYCNLHSCPSGRLGTSSGNEYLTRNTGEWRQRHRKCTKNDDNFNYHHFTSYNWNFIASRITLRRRFITFHRQLCIVYWPFCIVLLIKRFSDNVT